MTRRKISLSIFWILLVGFGLYISSFFCFFQPFQANFPPVSTYEFIPDSHKKAVLASPGTHYQTNAIGSFFLGKHYRFLWTTPVKVPVFSLKLENMKIGKRGGGMQTTSFTLLKNNSEIYNLRSIDKNPLAVLPKFWHRTVLLSFVRDQISATDPYASLVVAQLAKAVGIFQPEPKMVYLMPGDSAFKNFSNVHGFFMLYPKTFSPVIKRIEAENNQLKFIGSYTSEGMLQMRKKSKEPVLIDSLEYLKCRLFDLLISDWDRHQRQWDWLAFSVPNATVFKPMPKDRDQALGIYDDGLFPWLLTRNFAVRKITSFHGEYEDLPGFVQNGFALDTLILKKLPEHKFTETASLLINSISDSVINAAVSKYPPEVYDFRAPEVKATLKARRQKLPEAARAFYQLLHQNKR